jgi:alkaline phosphatase D
MVYKKISLLALLLCSITAIAQVSSPLVSGPWAGNVELRSATVWAQVSADVKSVAVKYLPATAGAKEKTVWYKGELGKEFNPVKIELNGLDINTRYTYTLVLDGKAIATSYPTGFATKDLWQWRKPAPDFSFLAGSCAYFNEPAFDRPGKPYGGDSSIFETMANTPAAFHIWLGDNWYTREVDYSTAWGLSYRASRDRSMPVLQKFMASMPQYAIWDDHDFGPNDMGKSYLLKDDSRKVFIDYALNPAYGENGQGIYSLMSYSDVDFFLTDDRFFRSEVDLKDSVDGNWNTEKTYFGRQQMSWLKNALLYSRATFKVIATGSQVINPFSEYDCMRFYKQEYAELMDFLEAYNIKGVVFFSGDRHHSEVVKKERLGSYPLYDVTNSPYTSGVGYVKGAELTNPARVAGTLVQQQNFTRVSVSGKKNERVMKVEFLGVKGDKLGEWSVSEKELK